MPTLSKEQILGYKTSDIVPVTVPELGGEIKMRAISGAAFEDWIAKIRDGAGKVTEKALRVRTIILCACNDSGELLFTETDLPQLNELPSKILNRLFKIAQKQAGLDDEEKKDLVGKSEATRV